MERVEMLVSDLDGTLLGDERALDQFRRDRESAHRPFRLVYSSGRFIESVRDSIREHALPEPDAIICGVGTAIYDDRGRLPMSDWPQLKGGWDPVVVRKVSEAFSELRIQPEQFLSTHKISYYGENLDQEYLNTFMEELMRSGVSASIVYSSNRDVDVLPAGIDKGAAARFLATQWNIDTTRIIVAGDSGNDLSMFQQGYCGIVVANAQPELLQMSASTVYHAGGAYAAGVCEGLKYWRQQWSARKLQAVD